KKMYLGLGISFLLVVVLAATVFAEKDVLIQIDEVEISNSYRGKKTVEDILVEENIELIDADDISLDFDHVLEDGDAIRIIKAAPVKVSVDNRVYDLMTTESSVNKILDDL